MRDCKNDEALARKTILEKWRQKQGSNATYLMLIEALNSCERKDLIDSLFETLEKGSVIQCKYIHVHDLKIRK